MSDDRKVEIIGIDIARFLAATFVIMWHFAGKPFLTPGISTLRPLMPPAAAAIPPGAMLTSIGWIGVQIFFVISGAVIAFSATRAKNRKSFFVSRFARLWPAMLASSVLCSALAILFWHTDVLGQARRLTGSLVFSPVGPWFSGQVWTLPVEIAFYGVVGVVVVGNGLRRLERLAWCLAIWSAAYWLICAVWPNAFSQWNDHIKAFALLMHGCYFALGIALAMASTHGYNWHRLVLMGLAMATACYEITARAAIELGPSPYQPSWLVPFVAWLIAVGFISASFRWRERLTDVLGRSSAVIRGLGALTYPLYLVHIQTGGPVFAALISRGWPIWAAFLPAYGVSIAVAFLIVVWAERPLQKTIKARFDSQFIRRVGPGGRAPAYIARLDATRVAEIIDQRR